MLHVHSCYQFGVSLIQVDELVKAAIRSEMGYVALCDTKMHGIAKLFRLAEQSHLLPIAGIEIVDDSGTRISLFARNFEGYKQLTAYQNGMLDKDPLLTSTSVLKVYQCHPEKFNSHDRQLPHTYLAVHPDEPWIDHAFPELSASFLFFPPAVMLDDQERGLLEILRKIHPPIAEEPKGVSYTHPDRLKTANPTIIKSIENLETAVMGFEPYTLSRKVMLPLPPKWRAQYKDGQEESLVRASLAEAPPEGLLPEYHHRVEEEMNLLAKKGFLRLLLLVQDIVSLAREINCWVGPGRGSSVSSLVAHLMGITFPDPVKEGLLFERFISDDREDDPDIDIDFEDASRDRLFDQLRERYGKEGLCRIVTFGSFGHKGLQRLLEWKETVLTPEDKARLSNDAMKRLASLPKNTSTHAAGLVFSEDNLFDTLPMTDHQGFPVSQYDMDDLAYCGYTKIDLLGLSTLGFLKALNTRVEEIPIDDLELYSQIHPRNLIGIFQLDSHQGRMITDRFQPKSLEDTRILISLNRPGPIQSGVTEQMLQMAMSDRTPALSHPLLESILGETLGLPVYQEQVMQMLMRFGGFSGAEANRLRKTLSVSAEKMQDAKTRWMKHAQDQGLEESLAQNLFEQMRQFARYAFPKAHAAAYVYLTLACVWAKKRDPSLFYARWLNMSTHKPRESFWAVQEALQKGLRVMGPDLFESDDACTTAFEGIRFGLSMIPNLPTGWIREWISVRDALVRDNESVLAFMFQKMTTPLSEAALKSLVSSGALDQYLGYHPNMDQVRDWKRRYQDDVKELGSIIFGRKAREPEKPKKVITPTSSSITLDQIDTFGYSPSLFPCAGLRFQPFLPESPFRFFAVIQQEKNGSFLLTSGLETISWEQGADQPQDGDLYLCIHVKKWKRIGKWDPLRRILKIDGASVFHDLKQIAQSIAYIARAGVRRIAFRYGQVSIELDCITTTYRR